jgi:hypothetical protein
MHRWHHARDGVGSGSNFATIFSAIDRAFGTYYLPGLCNIPLGVPDEMGSATWKQLVYPFKVWTREIKRRCAFGTRSTDASRIAPTSPRAAEGARDA